MLWQKSCPLVRPFESDSNKHKHEKTRLFFIQGGSSLHKMSLFRSICFRFIRFQVYKKSSRLLVHDR